MALMAANPQRFAAFIAHASTGAALGLAEAAIRTDYVKRAQSSPARRNGVARALVAEIARWPRDCGCSEMASDAALANAASHAVHRALGFAGTERVVFFRKAISS